MGSPCVAGGYDSPLNPTGVGKDQSRVVPHTSHLFIQRTGPQVDNDVTEINKKRLQRNIVEEGL